MGNKTKIIIPKIVGAQHFIPPKQGEVYKYRNGHLFLILSVHLDVCLVLDNKGKKKWLDKAWIVNCAEKVC